MRVYCDMVTGGGGWLVFQRRKDGSQDFFLLTWAEYAAGFGDLNGEFWFDKHQQFCNRNLHALTTKQLHELRIDLKDNGDAAFAKYSSFIVHSESDEFHLTLGGYSGDAGDSIYFPDAMKFIHCANERKGGWWYGNCYYGNPNGLYLNGTYTGDRHGTEWYSWKGYHYSIQFTEMKIRPIE
ncbi:hypothetical protein CAPTEDRAFT_188816 [Capitella teleta]|uniref:Fibrinogen C-terminal domain-containing protein n=1 Tax=Capitella teleta TaxID=283909 RepID=R7VDL2_CAPTE|nr:hypothetical protein CAPTEDRAFT_188816 [Capitella teleta]|eukprot:ELU16938.1 hypothetical protein CAPTEDRAFT_188816 [Capitella teleta]